MRLVVTDQGASFGDWHADWVRVRRGVQGDAVRLLNPLRTGGNPLTEWDVRWAQRVRRFPGSTAMAGGYDLHGHLAWPPEVPQLVDRRVFDRWLRETPRSGRKPSLTYDEVLTVRKAKKYLDVPADLRWTVKPTHYHHIRSCRVYWWVEGINPQWVGFDWTFGED